MRERERENGSAPPSFDSCTCSYIKLRIRLATCLRCCLEVMTNTAVSDRRDDVNDDAAFASPCLLASLPVSQPGCLPACWFSAAAAAADLDSPGNPDSQTVSSASLASKVKNSSFSTADRVRF